MYVNPFIFGVLCTVGVEIAIFLICAIVVAGRSDKK